MRSKGKLIILLMNILQVINNNNKLTSYKRKHPGGFKFYSSNLGKYRDFQSILGSY